MGMRLFGRSSGSLAARGACWLAMLLAPGVVHAAHSPPAYPVLLVHGIAWHLEKADPIWGGLSTADPKQPAWSGMIGFLDSHGFRYGGEMQFRGPRIRLPDELDLRGVRVDPRSARLFSVAFSPSANTDGLAYKALELAEAIRQVRQLTGAAKVRIVAHSAGGLVARVYLQGALPGVPYAGDVDRLITISAPHLGAGMAGSLGDLLGTRATSIKPEAPLIQELNSRYDLPPEVTFASIVVRGLGADERGEGHALDGLIDRQWLERLPVEYRTGGDQLIHVRSQNLRLAPCAARYEEKTGRPVQYVLARVPYPLASGPLPKPYVHATAPSNASVQQLVLDLLDPGSPLWNGQDPGKLEPWIDRQARLHAQGAIEAEALGAHKLSQVNEITLDDFRLLGREGEVRSYAFAGRAYSASMLLSLRKRWTYVRGTMRLSFDKFGRVVAGESKALERRDE